MSRFSLLRNLNDIDEAVSLMKLALDLTPPGHSSRLAVLSTGGQVFNMRYEFRGEASDMTQALSCFESALELCTPDESFYLPLVANLASTLRSRYQTLGDVADLDRIVEISSAALSSLDASPNRDALLNNLANALKQRFEKLGNREDLDTALLHYQSCLDLRPPGHPLRHSVLGNFADAMLYRFEVDGRLQDLESATSYLTSALELRTPGQDGYLFYRTSLGVVLWRFFNAQGDTEKLEMAIGHFQTAMAHSTVLNIDHSRLLDNYSAALQTRYTLLGNIDDLDQAIRYLTMSSEIQPPTYPGRPITLLNLGGALANRFGSSGHMADINSVEKLAAAVQLAGPGHRYRSSIFSAYCRALSMRFSRNGDMQDLELAASTCKEALALLSPNNVTYPSTVANLTVTLMECFHKFGNIEECRIIIDHCDRALASARPADPACLVLKFTRCKAFLQLFQHGRERADIETCIDALREVILTLYEGHAEYVPMHLQLGIALELRFELDTDPKDLDESIVTYRVAHRSCKRGDMDYLPICMQLGNALRLGFAFHRDSDDALEEAIVLLTEVKETLIVTPGHSDYKASLVNLSAALFERFQALRSRGDLDMAIEHVSRALTLPTSSADFLVPTNLAVLLSVRYNEFKNTEDLERCVELHAVAAERMPPKHLFRGNLYRGYGHALYKLGCHRKSTQHLDDAVVKLKEALEHIPESHPDRPLTYTFLAEVLHERAKLNLDSDGLYDAINLLREVMRTLPEDSPAFRVVFDTAGRLIMIMYDLSGLQVTSFMEDGFIYLQKAARYNHFHSSQSVDAALRWARCAELLHHSSALLAYQTALNYLNRHLLTAASLRNRRAALLDRPWVEYTSALAVNAASCAIARGELELAIEFSEQGRGLLWSQLSQSQTPLDDLRSASEQGRVLASDFERLSTQLAQNAIEQSESNSFLTTSHLTIEEGARRYRQMSKELEDVITRIHQQEGFQSFLGRARFDSLKRAAIGGPVILVNASRQRCDALIVLHDAPPRLVPLPDASLDDLTTLSEQLYDTLGATCDEKQRERDLVVVLRALWDAVVRPIAEELSTIVPRGARIWWCPTSKLTSLPLHAAGPYRKGEPNLANTYVSSYTPTLAALVRARRRPSPSPTPPAFVAIGQATPASGSELPSVDAELRLVASLVPRGMRFTTLSGDAGTADAALSALGTHSWAHMACHGLPDAEQPFSSAFALRDREMTVLDVVRARGGGGGSGGGALKSKFEHKSESASESESNSTANVRVHANFASVDDSATTATATGETTGDFAFLSACHTTAGDRDAPDEIIHLAAAMQFAGFRSVIGTMWAVDDGTAHAMVGAFYAQLDALAEGEEWDCTQAARALNRAAKTVDKSLVSIDQRIVFIHIGA